MEWVLSAVMATGSFDTIVATLSDAVPVALPLVPVMVAVPTATPVITPVVELIGWRVLKGFETKTLLDPIGGDAGGVNIVNLKFGARTSFNNSGSFYVGFGWHLTDAVWYDKMLRIEYRAGF